MHLAILQSDYAFGYHLQGGGFANSKLNQFVCNFIDSILVLKPMNFTACFFGAGSTICSSSSVGRAYKAKGILVVGQLWVLEVGRRCM